MAGVGSPTFSSENGAIADVSDNGTVTALAAGTAVITASLTVDGVTKTATTTVAAQVAPANATVTAPGIHRSGGGGSVEPSRTEGTCGRRTPSPRTCRPTTSSI